MLPIISHACHHSVIFTSTRFSSQQATSVRRIIHSVFPSLKSRDGRAAIGVPASACHPIANRPLWIMSFSRIMTFLIVLQSVAGLFVMHYRIMNDKICKKKRRYCRIKNTRCGESRLQANSKQYLAVLLSKGVTFGHCVKIATCRYTLIN